MEIEDKHPKALPAATIKPKIRFLPPLGEDIMGRSSVKIKSSLLKSPRDLPPIIYKLDKENNHISEIAFDPTLKGHGN